MSSPAKKAPRAQSLVEKIVSSSLTRHGGFGVVDAPMGYSAEKMLAEADRVFSSACETDVSDPDDEEMRGGNPARRFFSATAGPVQDAFYQNSEVARLLSRVAGVSLCPAGAHGTYSYYFRAGDYLSIHRDVEECKVAAITCLYSNLREGDVGGLSAFYPARALEKLSSIRASSQTGRRLLRLHPGQTLVLFGGIVPHAVLPLTDGQVRIVSVMCYDSL